MKKLFKTYAITWAIAFALFQLICFVTPSEIPGYHKYNATFWASYIFVTLAFIGQLFCAWRAFQTDRLQRLFYNMPILRISYIGLIVMLVTGGACALIPDLPAWIAIIVCGAVLAFTAIAVVKTDAAAEIIEEQDAKLREKTDTMKELREKAALCVQRCEDPALKKQLTGLAEDFRYADPVSNDQSAPLERELKELLEDLLAAIRLKDYETCEKLVGTVSGLLQERNLRCREGK